MEPEVIDPDSEKGKELGFTHDRKRIVEKNGYQQTFEFDETWGEDVEVWVLSPGETTK